MHDWFLSITEYGEGGRQGVIVISEGYEGQGWEKFIVELHKFTNLFPLTSRKRQEFICSWEQCMGLKQKDHGTTMVVTHSYAKALNTDSTSVT